MQYFQNGSKGILNVTGGNYPDAVIVEANEDYVEFETATGQRKFVVRKFFIDFAYQSDVPHLHPEVKTGAQFTFTGAGGSPWTIRGFKSSYFIVEDPSGNVTVNSSWPEGTLI